MPGNPSFIPAFDFHEHVVALWSAAAVHDTVLTILMGALVATACGWIGCYLILQGMALVGDAISHTVLLGIVVAFLVTGQATGWAVFVGAVVTGVCTAGLIETLHRSSRLKEDAAIGIVFTSLFALGVVLLSVFAGRAHIDTQHVLYGALELVTNGESISIAGFEFPVAVCQMALVAALVLALILAFYKELLVVSFDPQLAASLGLRPALVRYGMMAGLSLCVVSAFNAVGAILVVAMLIAPAATAYLLTRRLPAMLALSSLVGAISSFVGWHVAYWLAVSAAGAMVCVACSLFTLAFLFAPQQGLIAGGLRRLRLRLRMNQENIVRHMLKAADGTLIGGVARRQLGDALQIPRWEFAAALAALRRRGWIELPVAWPGMLRLSERGRAQAERLDRAHRLWETFLVEKVGLASDHVHPAAETVEHLLSEQLVERVDDVLGHPVTDPHGAPIPRSAISDRAPGVFTLSKLRVGDRGRIVGLLDRLPEPVASETAPVPPAGAVAALGLTLGQEVAVVHRAAELPTWSLDLGDGRWCDVAHELADLVLVQVEGRA